MSAVLIAACGSTAVGSRSTTRISIEPSARPGQLPTPPGRGPTLGPRAADASKANGVQLNVLTALRDDTPSSTVTLLIPTPAGPADAVGIFYSTNTTTTKYTAGAHIPVIELPESSGFEGHYLGDALPVLPDVDGAGVPVGAVGLGPPGRHLCAVLRRTPATAAASCVATPSPPGCVRAAHGPTAAMCISRATSTSPLGPFVDDSPSAFVCPVSNGGAIDPSVFIQAGRDPLAVVEERRRLLDLPTTIYSQQLAPDCLWVIGAPTPAHRRLTALGGEPGRGPLHDPFGHHLLAVLLGQSLGHPRLRHRHRPLRLGHRPLHQATRRAWLASSDGGQTDPGPGGEEFFTADGLIWMVHHALAPGQSGNFAQRRLYVDLLAFPAGQVPRVPPARRPRRWPRPPSTTTTPICPPSPTRRTSPWSARSGDHSRMTPTGAFWPTAGSSAPGSARTRAPSRCCSCSRGGS